MCLSSAYAFISPPRSMCVCACVCVSVNIFDCTLRAHLWSATLTGAVLLSLYLSLLPSLPLQVLTSVDCLWPLVL